MFDATALIRSCSSQRHTAAIRGSTNLCKRSDVPSGIKYYIVNFNSARDLTPNPALVSDLKDENALIDLPMPTTHDRNFDAPEWTWDSRVNCYSIDVYTLGKVFDNRLVSVSILTS
jgi:hypothetical protein